MNTFRARLVARVRFLVSELRRRKVWHVTAAYATVGVVLIGSANDILPRLHLPDWTVTFVVVTTVLGLPIAVLLAWANELRPAAPSPAESALAATGVPTVPVAPSPRISPDEVGQSLVVLPFEDLSPDPENAFFASGLTEELIADLSRIDSLRVISRTSSLALRRTQKDIGTIARELDVRFVLEGSVRRAGNALRITAQLIDAPLDRHLWAEKYSGTLDDVFDLQEQISRQIVTSLRINVTADEQRALTSRPIPDPRAYEHYLRARGGIYSFDGAAVERALRDLSAGLEILGENVTLLRGLGLALFQKLNAGLTGDLTLIGEIERCAARIRALDSADPGSCSLLGLARVLEGDMAGAVVQLREAHRRSRNDPDVLLWLAVASLSTGQMDLAEVLVRQLRRADPLAPLSSLLVGYHAFFAGRFEDSAALMEEALRLGPEVLAVRWQGVRAFVAADRFERAEDCATFLRTDAPGSPFAEAADLLCMGTSGRNRDVMPPPSEALRTWAARDAEWSQYLSDAYASGGDGHKALEWLEAALAAGFLNDMYLSNHDPFIERYRDDPAWQRVLQRIRERRRVFESQLAPI